MVDRARKVARGVHAAVGEPALGGDVHVGNLGDDHRGRPFNLFTTGHVTSRSESSSTTPLTGRVTKIVRSLPCDTMLVKKYCSAIGPRMMPITSGGMGRS